MIVTRARTAIYTLSLMITLSLFLPSPYIQYVLTMVVVHATFFSAGAYVLYWSWWDIRTTGRYDNLLLMISSIINILFFWATSAIGVGFIRLMVQWVELVSTA